jgi:hypothetical protein
MVRILMALCALLSVSLEAQTLSEGFDSVAGLAGAGWVMTNNSNPAGTTSWFQGDTARFNSQAGANDAYVAANYNAGSGTATISLWLITPPLSLTNGGTLTFYTRVQTSPSYPDRMQVRMNTLNTTNVGTLETDVGDFTSLLLDINPTLLLTGTGSYPTAWTQFSVNLSGITGTVTGRIAFRYFVTNGGPSGANSEYIGLDTVNYSLPAPNLSVFRGATPVTDGGTDNVGTAFSPGVETAVTYTLANIGTAALNLTNPAAIGALSNCSVVITQAPSSPVSAFSSTSTGLTITPTASGTFSFTYSIANNDPGSGKNPYNFTVSGNASVFAQPEIAISRDGVPMADGGTDSAGAAFVAGTQSTLTYLISNSGTGALTLSAAQLASQINCAVSISTAPATSVGAGQSTGTTLSVTPTASGVFSFTYSLPNNDGNENPYNYTVNGTAGSTPSVEIHVVRGASAIVDGGTDAVGNLPFGQNLIYACTIRNQGTAALSLSGSPALVALSGASNLGNLAVTTQPAASVAAGAATSFTVSFRVLAAGAFSLNLTIPSNDSDENPYDWTFSGLGVAEPELDVSRAGGIPDGGTDDLGVCEPSAALTLTYTLANTGNSPLLLGVPISVTGALNCTATVTTQPAATINSGATSPLVVTVTPTSTGPFSVNVSVTNSDSNEGPYNWTISGEGGTPLDDSQDDESSCTTADRFGAGWLLLSALSLLFWIERRKRLYPVA